MDKINLEEFNKIPLHGRGKTSPFYDALLSLKVREGLLITKKEWGKRTYPPTLLANHIQRKYGFKFQKGSLPDRSGWAVKRVS